jgi:hypothetical protein
MMPPEIATTGSHDHGHRVAIRMLDLLQGLLQDLLLLVRTVVVAPTTLALTRETMETFQMTLKALLAA